MKEKKEKIDIVFLDDLYKKKLNYFIDLKNIYRVKYHMFQWVRYMCSKVGYDRKEFYNDINCLFCNQKIDSIVIIYADILIFNNQYQYDANKILLLSEGEYNLLINQKKFLFLNDKWLEQDKIYKLLPNIKDHKNLQLKKIKSYEAWVKSIMNFIRNYEK